MLSTLMIERLEKSVKGLLDELGWQVADSGADSLQIRLEQPSQLEHGDYSTNIAMQLAKVLRKPPIQIAELIKARIEQEGYIDNIARIIEVASPGFLNISAGDG